MATNVNSGRVAYLTVATGSTETHSRIGAFINFNLSVTRDNIPVVHRDTSGWTEMLSGIASWTFTAEAAFLTTGATAQQDELRSFLSSETRNHWIIQETSASTAQAQSGFAFVGGWEWSGAQDGPQLTNFTLNGDGALSEG